MFPDRVRAAVLDGAVAPSAWAGNAGEDLTLSTFIRAGSDFGSAATVRAFLDACGAVDPTACAFSAGSPEATRTRWDKLLDRAKAGIPFQGDTIDDRAIRNYVGGSIYITQPIPGFDRFPGWPAVAEFLQAVWEASESDTPSAATTDTPAAAAPAAASPAPYVNSIGRQLAVICGESPNPDTVAAMSAQVLQSYARAGLSAWPFIASCAGWEARATAPYLGPWNNPTPTPVLVIGNTFDPATAFGSSVRMAQELADARLLVVHGYGHTVLMNPSNCAQDHIAAYLIDGTLPPTGAACTQDTPPFPGG
jgi:pimeloyl-ACP methyl ester carboxylesterase